MKKNIIQKTLLSIAMLGVTSTSADGIKTKDTIGINIGKNTFNYSLIKQTAISKKIAEPNKSFHLIEVTGEYGTLFRNDIKPYFSYTYSKNDDIKHQYLLIGANKYFKVDEFLPYVGIVVGYGQIDWKYDPINNSKDVNVDANSFIAGLNLGINYNITQDLALNLNSKVLFHNYETQLEPNINEKAIIEHDRTTSISIGLKYLF